MSILCINCRGLGEFKAVRGLRDFFRRMKFYIVFLSEIKFSRFEIDTVRKKIGDYEGVYVDARGRAGGLVFFWEKGVNIILLFYFLNYVDIRVELYYPIQLVWRFTGVYDWSVI